jgi:L-fuconate dehydratase
VTRVIEVVVRDIRFPTSEHLDGSDAMNKDPDYSATYVELHTDSGVVGTSLVFTIGRGNEIVAAAVRAYSYLVVGRELDGSAAALTRLSRDLNDDSQLRWLGPEKGVAHMAVGALVNAAWDLAARQAAQPLWRFIASLSPAEIVDCIDFRYLTDAMTREQALTLLEKQEPTRAERMDQLLASGYPAYTTSPGWLGYSDEKMTRLAVAAVSAGFDMIKLKVGANVDDDERRMKLAREAVGPDILIGTDANQRWDVADAITWMSRLAPYDPYWIEEPTAPDDALGHATIRRGVHPVRVATGEHAHSRVLVKQLIQAEAIDVFQLDVARVGGINELLAILLLCAIHDIPVCPHAGGVGLCEMVQHLSMADFVAVSGTTRERRVEFVDHLHEHFVVPAVVSDGRYVTPTAPGMGAAIHPASLDAYEFPHGSVWAKKGNAS